MAISITIAILIQTVVCICITEVSANERSIWKWQTGHMGSSAKSVAEVSLKMKDGEGGWSGRSHA